MRQTSAGEQGIHTTYSGHFFKRGRVQALGKVPVGMQDEERRCDHACNGAESPVHALRVQHMLRHTADPAVGFGARRKTECSASREAEPI
jgi:hypothetical protein